MVYQYVAYNEAGEVVKGKLSATSEEMATQMLGYAGYQPVSLKSYTPLFDADKFASMLYQVKPAEVTLFYRQLAMLLDSGTDIASSLELLHEQATNRLLKKVLGAVLAEVRGGSQLSVALSKYPKIFAPVYARLLGIGEQAGNLETVLNQVSDYMEKEAAAGKETKSALMLPVITFAIAFVVVALLITFILPSFTKLYASLDVEMPPIAKIMMGLGEQAKKHGVLVFLGLLIAGVLLFVYIKTPGGRYNFDKLMLRLPLVGKVRHLSELARCCRNMSLLFRAGLPLTEVMPLLIQGIANRVLARAFDSVKEDMIKGEGLSKPMAKNKLFLPMMVQMVRVGEETGSLEITLQAVARSYEMQAEDKMRALIGLIQPAMTLFIGLVVGVVCVTLMSAMTAMYGKL